MLVYTGIYLYSYIIIPVLTLHCGLRDCGPRRGRCASAASTSIMLGDAFHPPHVDKDVLQRCITRGATQLYDPTSYVLLSNAATGSTSLARFFTDFYPEYTSGAFSLSRNRFPGKGHSHAMSIADFGRWFKSHAWPIPHCFVLSLRDPASRLESAFRYDHAHSMGPKGLSLNSAVRYSDRTLSSFIGLLRAAHATGQLRQLTANATTAARLYAYSAGEELRWHGFYHGAGPVRGNLFLVSQSWYLRALNGSSDAIMLLCQERLSHDLHAAFTGLARKHKSGPQPIMHLEARRAAWNGGPGGSVYVDRRSRLSEADQVFVREVLYPWDTELHRWACTYPATRAVSHVSPQAVI